MQGLADWLALGAVVIVLIALSLKRSEKSEEFLVAGRNVGLFALVATLVMTEFNTSTLLAFSALGYIAGPMAISMPFIFLVGLGFYMLVVARKWKRFNRLSVAELFTTHYGMALGKSASLLLMLAMVGFSATYVKSLSVIFLPWFALSPWVLSLLLVLLAVVMTISGGLKSVVRADVVSFLLTLILLPSLLITAMVKFGGVQALYPAFEREQLSFNPVVQWDHAVLPFSFVLSLIVLTCFTYICSPWYGQKIFAAKNERTAFVAVGIASLLVFFLYGCTVLAAAYFQLESRVLADSQTVLPVMMGRWLPAGISGLGYGVLFMAATTTLVGAWSAIIAMIKADFMPRRASEVAVQRGLTLVIALLCWAVANLLTQDILDTLILANIPIAALSYALLAAFYGKPTAFGAWLSVIVGVVWGAGCYLYFGEEGNYTWYWAIYGIPAIFLSGAVGSFISKKFSTPLSES